MASYGTQKFNPLTALPKWVNVAVLVGTIIAFAATTKADVSHLTDRVADIESKGSPADRERLARIESMQLDQTATTHEINRHLNSIDQSLRRSR